MTIRNGRRLPVKTLVEDQSNFTVTWSATASSKSGVRDQVSFILGFVFR